MADVDGTQLLEQMMALWVRPELEKRVNDGRWLPGREPLAAQVLLRMNGRPIVRLDDEVRVVAKVRVNRPVEAGEVVDLRSIGTIEGIELTRDDGDCAHVTFLTQAEGRMIAFDFRYASLRAERHLVAGDEFLASTKAALELGLLRPAAENLFAAVELTANAFLLLTPLEPIHKKKGHGTIGRALHQQAKLGNIPAKWARLYSTLESARANARYLQQHFSWTTSELEVYQAEAAEFSAHTRNRLPRLHAARREISQDSR